MKIAIYTLGCKVNTYESEAIWELFRLRKYKRVEFTEKADVYLINTCTVTNQGAAKSRKTIRKAIKTNPNAVIAVMGCYSQTSPEEVRNIDGVDVIIGTMDRASIVNLVEEYILKKKTIVNVFDNTGILTYDSLEIDSYVKNTRAFIKVQDGCNAFCSYCIIPYARGNMRSRNFDSIIKEANRLSDNGYKEIILTGIHTGKYGLDINTNLFTLIKELVKVNGIIRIRISSIEVNELTDELIGIISSNKKIVNHLHIPLQSGCDKILSSMNRKYSTDIFYNKIKLLKDKVKDISITTDVIVGFPGETDEDFLITSNFIKKCAFSELHVFPYSIRTGTVAATMDNQIHSTIKTYRVNELIKLNEILASTYVSKFNNQVLRVIPETYNDGYLKGYSDNYIKVKMLGNKEFINKVVNVKINQAIYKNTLGIIIK